MKRSSIAACTLAAWLLPALAWAAPAPAEEGGSWLVWLLYVINFAIFVYLVSHYAAPAARSFFHERATAIRNNLNRLQSDFQAAQLEEQQARAALGKLDGEKTALQGSMRAETARETNRIAEQARASAERIRRDGELTAQAAAERARRELRAHLVATAIGAARELVAREFGPADQTRLVEEFMDAVRHGERS